MLQVINLPCLLTPLSLKISATCTHKIQHAAWVCVQGAVQGARRGLPVIWITPLHVGSICAEMCVCVCVCLRDREFVCVWGGGLLWELPTHPPPSKKGCIKEEGGEAPLSLRSQTQRQSLWTHTFLQGHSDYPQKRSGFVLDSPRGGFSDWKEKRGKSERHSASPVRIWATGTLRNYLWKLS